MLHIRSWKTALAACRRSLTWNYRNTAGRKTRRVAESPWKDPLACSVSVAPCGAWSAWASGSPLAKISSTQRLGSAAKRRAPLAELCSACWMWWKLSKRHNTHQTVVRVKETDTALRCGKRCAAERRIVWTVKEVQCIVTVSVEDMSEVMQTQRGAEIIN